MTLITFITFIKGSVVYGLVKSCATQGRIRASEDLPVYVQYGSIYPFLDGFFNLVQALGDLLG